jgi:FkbM family methyltransferase
MRSGIPQALTPQRLAMVRFASSGDLSSNVMNQIASAMEEVAITQESDIITTPSIATPVHRAASMWTTRYGIVQASQVDDLVTQSLNNYGEWAERELDVVGALLDEGNVALQYGAEYSAQTLALAGLIGSAGQVHVVEPRRLSHMTLCTSAALNGLRNVYPHHIALGDVNGHVDLPASSNHPQERTRLVALDSMEFSELQLLKINPLGCLLPVLAGASETLRQHKPAVYFRLSAMELAINEIATLKAQGYRCWSHLPYLYNQANFTSNKRNIFPGFVNQNVIAVHKSASTGFDHLTEL